MRQSGFRAVAALSLAVSLVACAPEGPTADLLLVGGRVYTLSWPDPDGEGRPAATAPYDATAGWRPDAEAIAIKDGQILFVGSRTDAQKFAATQTQTIDLKGATVVPGLIDSHVHLANLGASLERVNLVGVKNPTEAVERVVARAARTPKGEWIAGWGWDEGAWASQLPDMKLLSERVPDHPVVLTGLHTFAVWGNRLAFDRAGITRATPAPAGGEIKKDAAGNPTGVLLNNASALLTRAVPAPTSEQLKGRVLNAIDAMVKAGFTAVHEAGLDTPLLEAMEELDREHRLPIAVHAMLAARDPALADPSGPALQSPRRRPWRFKDASDASRLRVIGVKAFYDGAMGSRGAFFLEPYSDRAGHRGVGGAEYGFERDRMAALMKAGYQVTIHAIGDRANRESLDFFESVMKESPVARDTRPRIEHAQVVSPQDIPRFAALGVIASMQPSHAVEDMPWAEARIGPERLKGAYAWRSLRRAGAKLAFNSDLPATDFSIFYGLHSAVTRRDKEGQPAGGWRLEQAVTIEEAVRGWTSWAAYAGFNEQEAGTIAEHKAANLTVMDIDPFAIASKDPARLLNGRIVMTIVRGKIQP
jgi:predicted amidohydrolase YtcJ